MNINVKKIIKIFEKISVFLAEHIFLACLFLIFTALIIGGLLFYKYVILVQEIEPVTSETFQLKENVYQGIFMVLEQEKQRFQESDLKQYPNPFQKKVIAPEEGNLTPAPNEN